MTSRTGNNRRGFTLIEILVSVAILASAMVFILQALARSAYTLSVASDRLNAYVVSAQKMADLELALWQRQVPDPKGHVRLGRQEFDWHVDSSPMSVDDPQLEVVTLTVSWYRDRKPYASQVNLLRRVSPDQS